MATQHQVTFRQNVSREFLCEHCGTTAAATFRAKGVGQWVREGFFDDADSAQEESAQTAAADLTADADRVQRLLRCPACKLRAPGVMRILWITVGAPAIAALVSLFVFPDTGVWIALCLGVLGLWFLIKDLGRQSRARTAMFAKVERGKPEPKSFKPRPQPGPKPVTAPRMPTGPAPVAPVVPVQTSAPEITQPRGPDEGPAFLKN